MQIQQAFGGLLSTQPKTHRVFGFLRKAQMGFNPNRTHTSNPHVSTLAHNLIKTTIAVLLLPWSFCCLAPWKFWNLFVVCWSQDLLKMYVRVENWMMSVMLKHPRREHLEDAMKNSWEHPMISYLLNFPCGFSQAFCWEIYHCGTQQVWKIFRTKIAMEKDGSEYHGICFAQWDFCWEQISEAQSFNQRSFLEVLMWMNDKYYRLFFLMMNHEMCYTPED